MQDYLTNPLGVKMLLDYFGFGLAGAGALAALWFGFKSKSANDRMRRERVERLEAEHRMVDEAIKRLNEAKNHHANQAPVDLKRRNEFER